MVQRWTELNDLSTARFDSMGGGNSSPTASITFGGVTPAELTATEEWTAPAAFPARKSRTSFLQFYIKCF
jgi:hypothetical protein